MWIYIAHRRGTSMLSDFSGEQGQLPWPPNISICWQLCYKSVSHCQLSEARMQHCVCSAIVTWCWSMWVAANCLTTLSRRVASHRRKHGGSSARSYQLLTSVTVTPSGMSTVMPVHSSTYLPITFVFDSIDINWSASMFSGLLHCYIMAVMLSVVNKSRSVIFLSSYVKAWLVVCYKLFFRR